MKKLLNYYRLWLLLITFGLPALAMAQSGSVAGTVKDEKGQPMPAATVQLQGTRKGAISDRAGQFNIDNVAPGTYTVQATFVGFATQKQTVVVSAGAAKADFVLAEDALEMETVVITGSFDPRTKLESSVAITTINARTIDQRAPRGTGDLLQSVPGVWVDNSSGEVGSKVVARGLAPVGNDQVGFQYVSLQEEGLPVMGAQMGFSLVDMYQRTDLTTARMEAIRGGSAAITSANSPGGIFNFISKTGGNTFSGSARVTGGIYGNGKGIGRTDVEFGGPLAGGFNYHIGGFYRVDGGARNTPFNANQGGQIRANVSKLFANGRGSVKVYGKYLDDHNTFFKEIALNNDLKSGYDPGNGDPVNINYSTTFIDVNTQVPVADEYRKDNATNATRTFDAKKGIANKSYSAGLDLSYDLGSGWGLTARAKVSNFDQAYLQYQGNLVLPVSPAVVGSASLGAQQGYLQFGAGALASAGTYAAAGAALAGAISGAILPGVLSPTYYDAKTGEVLARSVFGLSNGVPVSTLDPNTPNKIGKYLLGTVPLNMYNKTNDQIASLNLTKEIGGHQLTFGTYYSHTEINTRWFADGVISTMGNNPRAVRIEFPAPATFPASVIGAFGAVPALAAAFGGLAGGGPYQATDPSGIVLQSGLAYTITKNVQNLNAFYLNDVWKVTDKLSIDLGARYETVRHTGMKQGWQGGTAVGGLGGLDKNPKTTYDIGSRVYNGDEFVYGVSYQPVSATSSTLARDPSNGKIIVANADGDGDGPGFKFNYLSWSVGGNYKFTNRTAGYLRVSRGNKAPELDYYANNFVNIPLDRKAPLETVTQAELGFKANGRKASFSATGFYSYLDNALLQLFITSGSASFFTDPTFNATRTIGLELETVLQATDRLTVRAHATVQDAKYARLTYLNVAGGVDRTKFFTEDFSGNRVLGVAPVIVDITPTYRVGKFSPYLNYRWFSERQGNRRNSVQLAAYGVLSAGVSGALTSRLDLSIQASNLLNSAGILLFGGYGLQGTSLEDIAVGGIKRPDGTVLAGTDLTVLNSLGSPVFGRPVLARQLTASLTYRF